MINLFDKRLTELLAAKEITQKELAQKTHLSEAVISNWKHGQRQPTADNVIIIAEFFDVTADYLLGTEDDYGNKVKLIAKDFYNPSK